MNPFLPVENQASSFFGNFNVYRLDGFRRNRPKSETNEAQSNCLSNQFYCDQIEFKQLETDRSSSCKSAAVEKAEVGAELQMRMMQNPIRSDQIRIDNTDQSQFKKPNLSYIALISQAINSRPDRRITLKEIYQFIEDTYPYYRFNHSRWQNSVRHNLSLNRCFERLPQRSDHGSKSNKVSYWTIRPNASDEFNGSSSRTKTGKPKDHYKAVRKTHRKATRIDFRPNSSEPTTDHQLSQPNSEVNKVDETVEKMICQDCKLSKRFNRIPVSANSLKFTIRNLIKQQSL